MADLKLALTEAVSNSVRHAYGHGGDGHVEVITSCTPTGSRSRSSTTATASTRTRRRRSTADELSEGGLGIAIIRTIADEFEIDSQPGTRGSRLRFVKNL